MNRSSALVVLAALIVPLAAAAQVKPEQAIRARQSIMQVMNLNVGPLVRMGSGDAQFDKAAFQENALRLESIWAMNPAQYFIPGTDKPVKGSKIAGFTNAKPEIWSQPDKFKAAAERVTKDVTSLGQAARAGDEKRMRSAAGEVAKSCKACHDTFRE